ncbi:MAG: ABC transporter ATP-binding protein, partial [Anaerolineae bacterium]|nr:ABC transporter ATP-binding protein [Anaerolineae bacterium]
MSKDPRAVLSIKDLSVSYETAGEVLPALRAISLDVFPGEMVGLVGESGSGKTTLALAVMRYLNPEGCVESGRILFRGEDLLALSPTDMQAVWGKHIALVPQDPYSSLNPSMRIGEQIAEILRYHSNFTPDQVETRVAELLEMVRLSDVELVAGSYPHQISGGMRQRVLIAMALSTEPSLLILDEPTTGLDVTTESAILDLLRDLIKERNTAVLYVTHNLGVVAGICDRVAVLYSGELVELAPTHDLYAQPLNPYTRGLLDSVPRMGQYKDERPIRGIAGSIPSLGALPAGCA